MSKLKLKRMILDGNEQKFEFDTKAFKYLVKNFTEEDIYVSFDSPLVEDESIKIQAGMGQTIVVNERYMSENNMCGCIYVKGTGEVEVQQINWIA